MNAARPFFRSVRSRVFGVIMLTTLCALLVNGGLVLYHDIETYRATRIADIRAQAELLSLTVITALQFDDPDTAEENLHMLLTRPVVSAAAVYNPR